MDVPFRTFHTDNVNEIAHLCLDRILQAQRQVAENAVNYKKTIIWNSKCSSNYKNNYKHVHANYNLQWHLTISYE